MKKSVALLIALVLAYATTAAAQATGTYKPQPSSVPTATAPAVPASKPVDDALPSWTLPGPYALVQLGAYGPTDDDKDYDVYNPQAGFMGAIALGYRFSPYIATQLEFGYESSEGEYSDWEFSGMPVVAVAHLGIPVHNFEIYGLAGIGALFYNVDDINESHDEVAIMSKLGGGVAFHFGQWVIGGEVAYQMTDISYAPNDAMIGAVTIGFTFK